VHNRHVSAPAAKLGDEVVAIDNHLVLVPSPGGAVPTPTPTPFSGKLIERLSETVCVDNMPAAIKDSAALAHPPHVPVGGPFASPPKNRATVAQGSATVFIDNKCAARAGDAAVTCNDPVDAPRGVIVADGTVFVGG
jgi:uncharacterized Zn-binding protein involved in type VI secretion